MTSGTVSILHSFNENVIKFPTKCYKKKFVFRAEIKCRKSIYISVAGRTKRKWKKEFTWTFVFREYVFFFCLSLTICAEIKNNLKKAVGSCINWTCNTYIWGSYGFIQIFKTISYHFSFKKGPKSWLFEFFSLLSIKNQ